MPIVCFNREQHAGSAQSNYLREVGLRSALEQQQREADRKRHVCLLLSPSLFSFHLLTIRG